MPAGIKGRLPSAGAAMATYAAFTKRCTDAPGLARVRGLLDACKKTGTVHHSDGTHLNALGVQAAAHFINLAAAAAENLAVFPILVHVMTWTALLTVLMQYMHNKLALHLFGLV